MPPCRVSCSSPEEEITTPPSSHKSRGEIFLKDIVNVLI